MKLCVCVLAGLPFSDERSIKKNETEQNRIEQKTEGMREKKRNAKDIEIFKRKLKKKTTNK